MFNKKKSPQELFAQGVTLCNLGKWRDAIMVFTDCVKLDPKNFDAIYNLGVCYANTQDFENALEQYKKVIDLNSADAETYYNCGVAYTQLGDRENAILAYQHALEIDDRYFTAWANLASCYRDTFKLTLAEECLDKAIEHAPPQFKDEFENRRSSLKTLKRLVER